MEKKDWPTAKAEDAFANDRAVRAAAAANDNSRLMVQSALLINGGAATAVIAYLSKDKLDAGIAQLIPVSLAGYALGVLTAALAMWFMTECLDRLSEMWEWHSRGGDKEVEKRFMTKAQRWWRATFISFLFSVVLFASASFFLGHALTIAPTGPLATAPAAPASVVVPPGRR